MVLSTPEREEGASTLVRGGRPLQHFQCGSFLGLRETQVKLNLGPKSDGVQMSLVLSRGELEPQNIPQAAPEVLTFSTLKTQDGNELILFLD